MSRLIGSPPGYVGFEEGGQLTEKVRRHPYCVVLFDEMEKAHPDVFNLLLQVLDDGSLTDAQGRRADFRNTVVIMTSNLGAAGSRQALGFSGGGADGGAERDRMLSALRAAFPPEFLNRVDEILVFRPLGREELTRIARLMLEEVCRRALELDIGLSFDDSAVELVAASGQSAHGGARPLRRAVVRLIEDAFSTELLEGRLHSGDRVRARASDGKIVFDCE